MKRTVTSKVAARWLWGSIYKGLEVQIGTYVFWLGHTDRESKSRGW